MDSWATYYYPIQLPCPAWARYKGAYHVSDSSGGYCGQTSENFRVNCDLANPAVMGQAGTGNAPAQDSCGYHN